MIDSGLYQTDHATHATINKDEFELRAPLVEGEDPSVVSQINHRHQKSEKNRSLSDIIHHQSNTAVRTPVSASVSHEDDRLRAAASVFAWLRRPQLFRPTEMSSRARLARNIDHISKTVFTLLFGLFSFFYFLTYAVIKPAQLEAWIETEFDTNPTDPPPTTTTGSYNWIYCYDMPLASCCYTTSLIHHIFTYNFNTNNNNIFICF